MKKYIERLKTETEVKIDGCQWILIGCKEVGDYDGDTIYRLGFSKETEDRQEPILITIDVSKSVVENEENTGAIIGLIERGKQYCFCENELIMDEEDINDIIAKYMPLAKKLKDE